MRKDARRQKNIERKWYLFDAESKVLGRLATQVAHILMGKNKPSYVPWQDRGDYVVVINSKKVKVSGRKEEQKVYFRHSGSPGGLKEETLGELRQRKPSQILRKAVKNMLPKNRLQKGRLSRLKIFVGEKNPYKDLISNS